MPFESIQRIAIIGGGAAGLMTAIQCGMKGIRCEIFDSQAKVGKKILIAGGGRCNITNRQMSEQHFNCLQPRFVKNMLCHFSAEDTVRYFESRGLVLKCEEPFQKYFPVTDRASDILKVFLDHLNELGVPLHTQSAVTHIEKCEDGFRLVFANRESEFFSKVVICTGGMSVPQTGSNGTGYGLAKGLGHSVTPFMPALTPLLDSSKRFSELSGYSLPCLVTLKVGDKVVASFSGPLLFTHQGYSGPAILNISRHYIFYEKESPKVYVSFLPEDSFEILVAQWRTEKYRKKKLASWFSERFSRRMGDLLLSLGQIDGEVSLSEMNSAIKKEVRRLLFSYELPVSGYKGFAFAEVTAGGIVWSEVSASTLESRIQKGLYFAGEILDVDGQLGGYNFQWAFASATCVANALLQAQKGTSTEP